MLMQAPVPCAACSNTLQAVQDGFLQMQQWLLALVCIACASDHP